MNKIEDMVNSLVQGDKEAAADMFNDIFSEKAAEVLNQYSQEIGKTFFDGQVKEAVHPTQASQYEADCKRTGKSHSQLADEHDKYAKHMRSLGKDGLAVRSELMAKDHRELAGK